jgi:putative oxidoreductase
MRWTSLDRCRDAGLLIVRLGFGLGFLYFHGYSKLMHGPAAWARTGDAMAHFGITFGYQWWGLAAALAESVGGLLFAAGLFFRFACLILAGDMLVATFEQYSRPMPAPEHAAKNLFLFLGMFLVGPGRYSLDHLFWGSRTSASGAGD